MSTKDDNMNDSYRKKILRKKKIGAAHDSTCFINVFFLIRNCAVHR